MRAIGILGVLGVILTVAGPASATGLLQNGSFESGLTGWSYSGTNVSVVTDYESWDPTDGAHFALLTTPTNDSTPQLLWQSPTVAVNDVLTFDYFFDEDNLLTLPDIAKITVGGVTLLTVQATIVQDLLGGWNHVSYTIPTAGDIKIQFGVQDGGLDWLPAVQTSALGIDNVQIASSGGDAVPEPLTMFSAFMAISSLGMYIRKRTRTA